MIRRLFVLLVSGFVLTALASSLHAQDIVVSSLATVDSAGQVLTECSFAMQNGFNLYYLGASGDCSSLLQGNAYQQGWCGTNGYGDIESDTCPVFDSRIPGDTYTAEAVWYVWFDQVPDGNGGLIYDDPFGYLSVSPLPCSTDLYSIGDRAPENLTYNYFGAQIACTIDTYTTVNLIPSSTTLGPSETQQYTTDDIVNWTLPTLGTFNTASLIYTAPSAIPAQTSTTLRACNVDNASDCAISDILLIPLGVSISPNAATLNAGQQAAFTPTATGTPNHTVTWSLSPANLGTLSAASTQSGSPTTFTATTTQPATTQTVTLTATVTSAAGTTTSAVATIDIQPISISVSAPQSVLLAKPSALLQFSANVSGWASTTAPTITWKVNSGVGTISATGLYQAPATAVATESQAVIDACVQPAPSVTLICASTSGGAFTLTLIPAVVITSMTPAAWPAGQTTTVTINGSGWGTSPTVTVSDATIGSFFISTVSPSQIVGTVTVQTFDAGNVTVTVTSTTNTINSFATATATISPVTLGASVAPTGGGSLQEGQSQPFASTFTCKTAGGLTCSIPQTATWSLSPSLGTFSPNPAQSTTYVAPSPVSLPNTQTAVGKACNTLVTTVCASFQLSLVPVTITVSPTAASVLAGKTQQFSASVQNFGTGSNAATWSISPAVGTINASTGLYTAPNPITATQTVTVTAASVADSTKKATASVSLTAVPDFSLTVTPSSRSVTAGSTTTYTVNSSVIAGFTGTVSLAMTVSPSGPTGTFSPASISPSGSSTLSVTVPSSSSGAFTITVTGTSGTLSHSVTASLQVPITVTLSPSPVLLLASQTQQFTASVVGTSTTTVNWLISPQVGTIDNTGLYTAPATISANQSVTVTACSTVSTTSCGTATVSLLTACGFSNSIVNTSFPYYGDGETVISINGPSTCSWTATTNVPWIEQYWGGTAGTGSGTSAWIIDFNLSHSARTGTITAGGQTFTITQAGVPGTGPITTGTITLALTGKVLPPNCGIVCPTTVEVISTTVGGVTDQYSPGMNLLTDAFLLAAGINNDPNAVVVAGNIGPVVYLIPKNQSLTYSYSVSASLVTYPPRGGTPATIPLAGSTQTKSSELDSGKAKSFAIGPPPPQTGIPVSATAGGSTL